MKLNLNKQIRPAETYVVKLTPLNFDGIVLDQKQNVMVYFYADFSKESKQLLKDYDIVAKITGHPEAVMVIDGKEEIFIKAEDKIEFKASKNPASLIRFSKNFFDRLRNKLRL